MLLPQAHLHAHGVVAPPSTDFILTVETTTPAEDFFLAASYAGGNVYDAMVDWGDGNQTPITAWNDPDLTHTYANAGTYEVRVSGEFKGLQYTGGTADQARKIKSVGNWGQVGFIEMRGFMSNANNIVNNASDAGDFGAVYRMDNAFSNCYVLNPFTDNWNVTDLVGPFGGLFWEARVADCNMRNWDFSGATGMDWMFYNANAFSTAMIDEFLHALYEQRNNFTWGSPAVDIRPAAKPSGEDPPVFNNPPITGTDFIYWLENDPLGEGFNTWSISY